MNKTIVVLANSKKSGGRCLAGKELVSKENSWGIGGWIRPVANESSGAVPDYLMSAALGHMPRLLEIIEVSCARPVPMPDQPENWLLEMPLKPKTWHTHGFFAWKDMNQLVDNPKQLWTESSNARRVKAGYVQKMSEPASLYLIKPDDIQSIEIWSESNQYGTRARRRAYIRYAKVVHEFDIDDVEFQKKYYPRIPPVNEPAIFPKIIAPKETLVCVSLTPEFKDHNNYKIAAAFFEPPQ